MIAKQRGFLHFYCTAFIKPHLVFTALINDTSRLRFGSLAVLLTALLYVLVYVFLILGGGYPSTFTPWLNIPAGDYYRYNVFLAAPSMFMAWILAAGVVQLLSRLFDGTGSFEDTLFVFGFGISIASWSTLLHDLISSFLGAVHIIDQRWYEHALNTPTIWRSILWALFALYLFWFNYLFTRAVSVAQKLRPWPSFLLGFIGFITYQIVFLIFNR